jgi:hypothetical protein
MRPAPPRAKTAAADSLSTNLNLQLRKDDQRPKLTTEQVEAYLQGNRRNRDSLLAAFRLTDDPALLKEAMQRFPNDPQVGFRAALDTGLPPDARRQWLDALEKSAPNNGLANYLSANNYFNSGQPDKAVQELINASGKPQLQDYTETDVESIKEAYLAAGYPDTEARAVALMQLNTGPQLTELRQLADNMIDLAKSYQQAGDSASAQATLQIAVSLGQEVSGLGVGNAIPQLTGQLIQRAAFGAMDPNSPYGGAGQTVQDQITVLSQQRAALMELGQQFQGVQQAMTVEDWANYNDRVRIFGQEAAQQWAVSKYGPP